MIYAATGHRPDKLGGYSQEAYIKLYNIAKEFFVTGWLHEDPATIAITGMALGWDQAWAEAALDLGIYTIAAVPFETQPSKWSAISIAHYEDLLTRCNSVEIICPGPYAVWKMQKRNEWMVDRCDKVVAMWDGTSGGTANCINYAKKVNKPIINLYNEWK